MMNILLAAFFLYLFSTVAFVVSITGRKWKRRNGDREQTAQGDFAARLGTIGYGLAILGVICHAVFVVYRMVIAGHFPTSNMFEFMSFLGFCIALAFLFIYGIYKIRVLGAFAMPLALILIAYASVFPTEVQPLIPALRSHWLYIHVTTVSIGEGVLAIGAVAGLISLLRTVDRKSRSAFWLEMILLVVTMLLAFIALFFLFSSLGYEAEYAHVVDAGTAEERVEIQTYVLPPLVIPADSETLSEDPFLGMDMGWFEAPAWMKGVNAARKFNTVIWSVIGGLVLYGVWRLVFRRRMIDVLYRAVKGVDGELAEEISYRAIAIGYPIFTLGGLIFAMIWAHEAWGRFWGWDPKEVWALITWLFYSAYLHLRLSRGWQGEKAAWLAVGGFIIIMINLVVINLVVSGLHSYA